MTTFNDDFGRSDSTNLGAAWVEVSGDWSIISGQLSSGSAGGTIILRAAGAMATSDHAAQVTIAATAAVSHGIWIRGNSNITQGYLFRNDGSNWTLFSVLGGSFTSIGSFAGAAVAGDVAMLQAVGSTIKAFVNGIARITVTDTAVPTGTSVGIRAESTNSLRFDNFSAADVTSGITGDAALSGVATLSASGQRGTAGAASLTATAALSASGLRATAGAATLAATAGLAADGVRGTAGAASLTVTASLSADGVVTAGTTGGAALAAAAALSASGAVGRRLDAALAASAALTAAGTVGATGGAALAITATLHASGEVGGAVVRGIARRAAGTTAKARRGEPSAPRAQRGEPTGPTARGGAE
ncbi:hypothetical protein [Streptomyces sp. NPDC004528]|uniref:hypothetical protein n=1 Tax=Streptomyces sp. NPDC004528 TaxID=3154550 RepID=UPI0033AEAFA3